MKAMLPFITLRIIVLVILNQTIKCPKGPLIIDIYYETLCPYCANFISNQFNIYYNYAQLKLAIINFHPYGFVKKKYDAETKQYAFNCHHGEKECYGNQISNCIIHILGRIQSYKYLICLESLSDKFNNDFKLTAEHCLDNDNNLKQLIFGCMENGEGNKLMLNESLNVPKKMNYVPWIEVNGKYSAAIEESLRRDLLSFICEYNSIECKP